VAPQVNQRPAAGQRLLAEPAAEAGQPAPPVPDRPGVIDLAQHPGVHLPFESHALLGETIGEVDHNPFARLLRGGEHLARLAGVHGHRLLAQDVTARFEGRQRERLVEFVGCPHAHHVQLLLVQHLLAREIAPSDAELVADFGQARRVHVGHGHDLRVGMRLVTGDVMASHAQTDDADTKFLHFPSFSLCLQP